MLKIEFTIEKLIQLYSQVNFFFSIFPQIIINKPSITLKKRKKTIDKK